MALSLTESLQIQVEWKQHMCFVHAHHENTSSIKINFKSLTVSLFLYTYKQPSFFQQFLKWAWNKLTMYLKLYFIPRMFADWISSNISVPDWLKTFPAISPSHTWLIILIRLKNNWINPCVKTEGKCNGSVNNEFKIMRKSNSLHQIMRVSK